MKTMNHSQFLELVREMRFTQKQYFRDRTQSALTKAKELEGRVDKYLLETSAKHQQVRLF
jgi:hypothetical protein